jgi:transposase
LRFSIRTCCAYDSFASLPLPLRASLASGSVVDACVSLPRFSPWKSTVGFFASSTGGFSSTGSSVRLKLLSEAHASISVPSTEKCKNADIHPRAKSKLLREHHLDKVPVSDLCEKYKLQPSVFYGWQRYWRARAWQARAARASPKSGLGGVCGELRSRLQSEGVWRRPRQGPCGPVRAR